MNSDFWRKRLSRNSPDIYVFELKNNHRNIIIDYDGSYSKNDRERKQPQSILSYGFLLSILCIVLLGIVFGYLLYTAWLNM